MRGGDLFGLLFSFVIGKIWFFIRFYREFDYKFYRIT